MFQSLFVRLAERRYSTSGFGSLLHFKVSLYEVTGDRIIENNCQQNSHKGQIMKNSGDLRHLQILKQEFDGYTFADAKFHEKVF